MARASYAGLQQLATIWQIHPTAVTSAVAVSRRTRKFSSSRINPEANSPQVITFDSLQEMPTWTSCHGLALPTELISKLGARQ